MESVGLASGAMSPLEVSPKVDTSLQWINNGSLSLGHREVALERGVSKDTPKRAFDELEAKTHSLNSLALFLSHFSSSDLLLFEHISSLIFDNSRRASAIDRHG